MGWEEDLKQAVTEGDERAAAEVTEQALAAGAAAADVIERAAVPGIDEAGRRWQAGDYFLPDVVLATEAFNVVMERVRPMLDGKGGGRGRIAIGSVEGDGHDLGKNIVISMLSASLYDVEDLGTDVPASRFVEAARGGLDVLGMGAYMTTTMRNMEKVVAALVEAGLRDKVKVIVGGAAVTEQYAQQIGADGYGESAVAAVELVSRLLGAV